ALVVLFGALAAVSWTRWADPIVDFGREPYVSWQLLEGRALYRDLDYLFGPLAPWANALWFRCFGASLRTLALCSLGLAGLLAVVVYRFARAVADRTTAVVATAVLLVVSVFGSLAPDAAGYDFVWPYTYAATHGMILLVCGTVALADAIASRRGGIWAGAG